MATKVPQTTRHFISIINSHTNTNIFTGFFDTRPLAIGNPSKLALAAANAAKVADEAAAKAKELAAQATAANAAANDAQLAADDAATNAAANAAQLAADATAANVAAKAAEIAAQAAANVAAEAAANAAQLAADAAAEAAAGGVANPTFRQTLSSSAPLGGVTMVTSTAFFVEILGFYETINGTTDFKNNILDSTRGVSTYDTQNHKFVPAFLRSMSYFKDSEADSFQLNSSQPNNAYLRCSKRLTKDMFRQVENINVTYNINEQQVSGSQLSTSFTCFKEHSKILTDKGYKPIQDLRKGDLVKTLKHDYRAIDMIGKREIYHQASNDRIKDQLYQCSQPQYPEIFEPLIITGCHCILEDDFTSEEQKQKTIEVNGNVYITENKYRVPACVDPRASVYEDAGNHTIYHLALENDDYYMNYGVYANGLLVETCSKRYLKELSNMTLIE
jgi:Hint domain